MVRFPFVAAISLALSSPVLGAGPGNGINAAQLLEVIENAPKSVDAREKLETYVRAAIEGAVAAGRMSGHPVICAVPRRGRFDAMEMRKRLLTEAPTPAEQRRLAATPVLIRYLAAEHPCT